MPFQYHLVEFFGGFCIYTFTVKGYYIRDIMGVKQVVDVHAVTTTDGRLFQPFGTAVVYRMHTVSIIDNRVLQHISKDVREFLGECFLFGRFSLTGNFGGLLVSESYAVEQFQNSLGGVLYTKGYFNPHGYALGINIHMFTEFLAQSGNLSAVKQPPIALMTVL